jgi:predicted ATPase
VKPVSADHEPRWQARFRVPVSLAANESASGSGARREMQLRAALGWSLMYTRSPARETGEAWRAALELAERLDDTDYRLRALWGLWAGHHNNAQFPAALDFGKRFLSLAADAAEADALVGVRLVGTSLHFMGDQATAREHMERVMARYVTPVRRSHIVRFQFEQRVQARSTLARVLWLQGFADQALRTVESNIDAALAMHHTLSLCNALAQAACPVTLFAGDLAAAERFSEMLLQHTASHGLDVWNACGRSFKGMRLIKRSEVEQGLGLLRAGVEEQAEARFGQYLTTFLGPLAEGLAGAGHVAQGLATIDEALARSAGSEERWIFPELLRIKGELLVLDGGREALTTAEGLFRQAIDWAHRQGALAWELRAATSLAGLWHRERRTSQARKLLAGVHRCFTEGFDTADLTTAKALLGSLR